MFQQITKNLVALFSYLNILGMRTLTEEEKMHEDAIDLLVATRQFCASKIALNYRLLERNFSEAERQYISRDSIRGLDLGDFVNSFPDQDFFRICILKQFMVEILVHSFELRVERLKCIHHKK
jgi:hypothetical protein